MNPTLLGRSTSPPSENSKGRFGPKVAN